MKPRTPDSGTHFWRRPAIDRRVFFQHAGAAVAGSFFLPGRSLETIAKGGRDAFYKGAIAHTIADYIKAQDGFLSFADLAAHKGE